MGSHSGGRNVSVTVFVLSGPFKRVGSDCGAHTAPRPHGTRYELATQYISGSEE